MTARPLLHALPTPSASERIASIQAEVSTLLADEAHGLVCHLKTALVHAEALAECPATKVGMRDIARRQVETLRKEIGFLEQSIGRA